MPLDFVNILPENNLRLPDALTMLVAALFVASGYPPAARWRRQLRGAAILAFLIALGAALVEVAIWLAGG